MPSGKSLRILAEANDYETSRELCGGTHASATGELGLIKILSEGAISAGTRRIEAVAGMAALESVEEMQKNLAGISQKLSCKSEDANERLEKLIAAKNELEKEIKAHRKASAGKLVEEIAAKAILKDGKIPFMAEIVEVENPGLMRELAVKLDKQCGGGAVVLGAKFGEKATILALCSKEAIDAGIKAGDIVREIAAKIGGKGGGKPDFAQGGGSSENLSAVFEEYKKAIS